VSIDDRTWAHPESVSAVDDGRPGDVNASASQESAYVAAAGGGYLSPDGRYYWSGTQWLPVPPQPFASVAPGYGPSPEYPQYWDGTPRPDSARGFAIASLVLGIVWLFGIGSVLAVIFGHIALSRIKRAVSGAGRGMAIAGLVLGYLGIGVAIISAVTVASGQAETSSPGNVNASRAARNAFYAEETYFVDSGAYTANRDELISYGFVPDDDVDLVVHATDTDYCVIASDATTTHGKLWYVYADGRYVGFYRSRQPAQAACGTTDPSDYIPLSGNGS
jgi:hypothetical protein